MNQQERNALDNHITGHYGEDQLKGEEDHPFKTYAEWRGLYPQGTFILHNTSETIEEAFEGKMSLITEMQPSIIDDVAGEFWFDTIRFDLNSLSKAEIVEFVSTLAADEVRVNDDPELTGTCQIEAWWD
jgi:hypothetical protein